MRLFHTWEVNMIRKMIGFIPVILPALLCWLCMAPLFGSEFYRTPLYRPWLVPWYMWLWLAASIASAVLLCHRRLIPHGLLLGAAPYLVILVQSFSSEEAEFLRIFAVCCLTFFLAYAVIYIFYHRELNRL